MRKATKLQRLLSGIMAFVLVMTTVLAGQVPAAAAANEVSSDVTLTVIGDSGNHSSDFSEHTGYVYWMKDVALDVKLDTLSDKYVAKNCAEQIKAALQKNQITAEFSDETTLYPSSFTKDSVKLESDWSAGYWQVIVGYADGTFSSDGWGVYDGAAQLKQGCRLIYYWSDSPFDDCRVSTDENWNSTLNYDTDAVTAVSLYTEEDPDNVAATATCEAGQTMNLTAKLTVPANSTVSRKLTWESTNPNVAEVTETAKGAVVTAKAVGTTVIKASMVNTLKETVSASCTLTVKAEGTTITTMSFEEGETLSLEPGDVKTLTPIYTPAPKENETAPSPVWTTTNADVVTVDAATGEMEAIKPGTAEIQASFSNNKNAVITAKCKVTVQEVPVTGIALNPNTLNLKQSEVKDISIRFTPENATQIPDIVWDSTDKEVATVVGNGTSATVTAVSGGSATITATVGSLTASCEVTVATAEESLLLKELIFAKDQKGENVYTMQSALDAKTKECTVIIPEHMNVFYLKPVTAENVTVSVQARYQNYNFKKELTMDMEPGAFTYFGGVNRALNADQVARDMTVIVTAGTLSQTYTVHMVRESLVASLNVTDASGTKLVYDPTFVSTIKEYELTVPDTTEYVTLSFKAYSTESTVLTVNGETAKDGSYTLQLDGNETRAVIKAGNENVVPTAYTLTVKRVKAGNYEFAVTPKDATVVVYDSHKIRQWGEENKFTVLPDETYTYTISKTGYITQTGTFTGSGAQTVALEKAPEVSYTQFESEWSGLRNDRNNQGITDAKTPVSSDSVGLRWESQYGEGYSSSAVSSQIIVDDKIYCYSSDNLLVLSKETGAVLKSTKMAGKSSFAINPPSYANGMIFVGLSGGIQAFNAETLESLWIYKDELGGQPNCSIRYDSGYVYTGFWNGETKDANWVCVSVTDEDPTQPMEEKKATWTYSVQGGFYWAGAYTNDQYVIVGSDDGESGSNSESSYVYVLDKFTGALVQKVGPCIGDIRSDISCYNGRIYFTTKAGYLYSYNLTADGRIDTEHKIEPIQPGTMSTSTPVVYNNRAYIGVTHGGNFNGTYGIAVIDIDETSGSMQVAYEVPTTGYPQTSGTLTTAYENVDGYVYVYFTVNSANGELYVVKDKAGMTQADEESGILYVPNHKQYCICSVVADKNGNLYFKNDSAYMMALTTNTLKIKDVTLTGGNAALYGETAFDGGVLNHTIVTDPGTERITLALQTDPDVEVEINGISGTTQDIVLDKGTATAEVILTSGDQRGAYTFTIRERSQNADLADILVTNSAYSTTTAVTLLPAFDAQTKEYRANYYKTTANLYTWAKTSDNNASIKAEAVSGISKLQTKTSNGYQVITVSFEDTTAYETPAVVKLIVTAEDGVTTAEYIVTLGFDTELPEITWADPVVENRKADTATIHFTSNQSGKIYYVTTEDGATVPTATNVKKGTAVAVVKGENEIKLSDLPEEACDVHFVMVNDATAATAVLSVDVDAYEKPVPEIFDDVNDDWYTSSVQYVYKMGIMTGYTHNTKLFGTLDNLSRAHFAVILYRLEGCPDVSYQAKFPDVAEGTFYTDAVMWAVENGIITGYTTTGTFGPADHITREQLVTILYRYATYKGYDVSGQADLTDYPDASKVSEFAKEAMRWAVANELITGDQGQLNPQGHTNRAVGATIITRFMKNIAE